MLGRERRSRRHPRVYILLLPLPEGDQEEVHLTLERAGEPVFDEGEARAFDLGEPIDHYRIVLRRRSLVRLPSA